MIQIETDNGLIEARDVIEGIPIDPLHPPSLSHIDPHRRWQMGTDALWLRRPWISTADAQVVVYCLRPAAFRPDRWGSFDTVAQAVAYITDPPSLHQIEFDDDLDF